MGIRPYKRRPVGADALVGSRLPPRQRQRKEEDGVSGPSPGPWIPQEHRVSSKLLRGKANLPPPAAGGTRSARTDPPKRFFLLDRARPILFLARPKREWGAHCPGQRRFPRARMGACPREPRESPIPVMYPKFFCRFSKISLIFLLTLDRISFMIIRLAWKALPRPPEHCDEPGDCSKEVTSGEYVRSSGG